MPPEKPESEEELEARLRKLLGEEPEAAPDLDQRANELMAEPLPDTHIPHAELSAIEDEFKDRLKGVDARLSDAQARHKKEEVKSKETVMSTNDAQGLGVGLSIAYAILGIPILMGGVGILVDKFMHTALAGLFTVTGVVLAMVYVFFVLNRQK